MLTSDSPSDLLGDRLVSMTDQFKWSLGNPVSHIRDSSLVVLMLYENWLDFIKTDQLLGDG